MHAYIKHISFVLPNHIEPNSNKRTIRSTGIYQRHLASISDSASSIAIDAAHLAFQHGFNPNSFDFIILCTQFPDFLTPTTACILQHQLGLPNHVGAFDFNLGCSGFIYGLSLANSLILSNQANRILLLTADLWSRFSSPFDHSTRPILSDAASATVIDALDLPNPGIHSFSYFTDGSLADSLIIPVGGSRYPTDSTPISLDVDQYGNFRSNRHIFMDGSSILDFLLHAVPHCLHNSLNSAHLNIDDINFFVFHQASRLVLNHLQLKCGLIDRPFFNNIENIGNTGSSSIPIALAHLSHSNLQHTLLVGFGSGLSVASSIVNLNLIV